MKHLPFDSKYRPNFQVVEQREGRTRLYPHTAQLPHLAKALHTEFNRLLPPRLSNADASLKDYHKIALHLSGTFFCNIVNGARKDDVLLFPLYDRDLLTRPAIVQQITEDGPMGKVHRFRFYVNDDFFPEIRADGRRLVFSDHAIKRFSDRGESIFNEDMSDFLLAFYGAPLIAMPVGPGRAFVAGYGKSILAFPYRQLPEEYFISSCLTINEIHSMKPEIPPHAVTLHYDMPYVRPRYRNWVPLEQTKIYLQAWERKTKPDPWIPKDPNHKPFTWEETAAYGRRMMREDGYGPGCRIVFGNNIPGPYAMQYKPDEEGVIIDEVGFLKEEYPNRDWDQVIAEREKEGTFPPARFGC